ncbi:MAG: transposase [Nitrospirae bacterium]|nr:transposase [Nitrospirota bacterium]
MPRIRRAVAAGFPHHVIQRGNNREIVFFDSEDRKKYLSLLKKYSVKWKSPIISYCLMSNHIHLLTIPESDESLFKMMQGLTLCYTQYINRMYQRTGRLWESRYHSCIVDKEKYLWAVARYIEQNPVRAGIVEKAEDYPYSSAQAHVNGGKDSVLGKDLFSNDQRENYILLLRSEIPREEIDHLRYATRTGRPFGNEVFVVEMGKKLERRLLNRPRGRPKKELP